MRWMGITAALGLCAFGAQAQIGISDRSGEDTLACLQRPATPKYPDEALETRTSGFYRLELRFTDAKRAPRSSSCSALAPKRCGMLPRTMPASSACLA